MYKLPFSTLCFEEGWWPLGKPGLKPQPCFLSWEALLTGLQCLCPPAHTCTVPGCLASACRSVGPCSWGRVQGNEKNPKKSCQGNRRLLWKVICGSANSRGFAHLPPTWALRASGRRALGECRCHPCPPLTFFWRCHLGFGDTCCQPPLASGQRESRELLWFSSSLLTG